MISLRLAVDPQDQSISRTSDFDPMREWPEFQKAIDEWKVEYSKKK